MIVGHLGSEPATLLRAARHTDYLPRAQCLGDRCDMATDPPCSPRDEDAVVRLHVANIPYPYERCDARE